MSGVNAHAILRAWPSASSLPPGVSPTLKRPPTTTRQTWMCVDMRKQAQVAPSLHGFRLPFDCNSSQSLNMHPPSKVLVFTRFLVTAYY